MAMMAAADMEMVAAAAEMAVVVVAAVEAAVDVVVVAEETKGCTHQPVILFWEVMERSVQMLTFLRLLFCSHGGMQNFRKATLQRPEHRL
ncbi:hypothetical protein GCM10011379_38690 [Filimonas zeae]|uniref:Uncharacterized protein n=1 Tax=Filimonas zeae TaxID=1737353 RepID=A0A917J196_9BACT|nr:hypothetical protein GCM10011379_38690 [Filimonas zeae]